MCQRRQNGVGFMKRRLPLFCALAVALATPALAQGISEERKAQILERWEQIKKRDGEFERRNEQFLNADLTDEDRAARFDDMKSRWGTHKEKREDFLSGVATLLGGDREGTDSGVQETANGGSENISTDDSTDGWRSDDTDTEGRTATETKTGPTESTETTETTEVAKGAITPPGPAQEAGLTTLDFNDEFNTISLYHPDTNPSGTWLMNDFWMNANGAGYVDLGSQRHFNINQTTTDTAAAATMRPYFPVSQPETGVMRMRALRARNNAEDKWLLSEDMRTLVNNIAHSQNPGLENKVTWTGVQLTAYRYYHDADREFGRPAFVEGRVRFSPYTIGFGAAFWQYASGNNPANKKELEIDTFESDHLKPDAFNTNVHSGEGNKRTITHDVTWADGRWHTIGLQRTANSLKIYWDGVLSGSFNDVGYFDHPMRLMMGLGGPPYSHGGLQPDDDIRQLNFDIDYVRVWRPACSLDCPYP